MISVLATLVALTSPAVAEEAPRFEIHEQALPSGDTLVVVPDDRAPVVYLRVDFPVGEYSPWALDRDLDTAWSIQEYDPDGDLRRRADRLAVRIGLGSNYDTSWLTVSCLAEDLDAALDLAVDVLTNTSFDRAELRRWKKGERLDWKGSQTDPGWQASRATARVMYDGDDPRQAYYAGPERVERNAETLAATRDAVLAVPGRVVGVSGDVDLDTGRRVAEALLPEAGSEALDGDPAFPPLTPEDERDPLTVERLPDLTQVTLRLTREALPFDDPDHGAALIAAHVLGGHAHARLNQALRYDDGSTYGVSVGGAVAIWPSAMSITTSTRADNAPSAEARLLETLAVFHRDGITDEERRDAVTHLLGQEPFREQGPWSPMGERMFELRHGLPEGHRRAVLQRASELTTDEVNDFIARFYDPASFSRIQVVPR